MKHFLVYCSSQREGKSEASIVTGNRRDVVTVQAWKWSGLYTTFCTTSLMATRGGYNHTVIVGA